MLLPILMIFGDILRSSPGQSFLQALEALLVLVKEKWWTEMMICWFFFFFISGSKYSMQEQVDIPPCRFCFAKFILLELRGWCGPSLNLAWLKLSQRQLFSVLTYSSRAKKTFLMLFCFVFFLLPVQSSYVLVSIFVRVPLLIFVLDKESYRDNDFGKSSRLQLIIGINANFAFKYVYR